MSDIAEIRTSWDNVTAKLNGLTLQPGPINYTAAVDAITVYAAAMYDLGYAHGLDATPEAA